MGINQVDAQYDNEVNLKARQSLFRSSPDSDGYFRRLFDSLPKGDNLSVLELGCGNGRLWEDNVERIPDSWNLTLMDQSRGMLDVCRAKFGERARYVEGNIEVLPFEDNSFDTVICYYVLYHVLDLDKALREVRRVLRPEGEFHVITVDAAPSQRFKDFVVSQLSAQAFADYEKKLRILDSFCIANAEQILSRYFHVVDVRIDEKELFFKHPDQVLAKIRSFSECLKKEDYSLAIRSLEKYFSETEVWKEVHRSAYVTSKHLDAEPVV